MDYVYHGSNIPNLKVIKRNTSTHMKNWVYATPSKAIATIFLSSIGGDLYYRLSGNGIDQSIELVERKEGMFKEIFNCDGYIYKLNSQNFKSGLTGWSGEIVSEQDEEVLSCEYIENVYDELLKLDTDGLIRLYLYPNKPNDIPLDNSDLIAKVIRWENCGFDISKFHELYPELEEKYLDMVQEHKTK